MKSVNDLPIRQKLILIQLLTAFIVLVLASALYVFEDIRDSRAVWVNRLNSTALLIGENSVSALAFFDAEAAEKVLSSLAVESHITQGCIYDAEGAFFAAYARENDLPCPTAPAEGHAFGDASLTLARSIEHNGESVGAVYLHANMEPLRARLWSYLEEAILVLALGLVLSVLLAVLFQKQISTPILHLTEAAKNASQTGDYTVRVPKEGGDEVGQLCDEFNAMLGQIEARDTELRRAREALEVRVRERTGELSQANEALQGEIRERQQAQETIERINDELVGARDEALAANRAKSEFLANMSHELRTPLNAVVGYSDMLKEEAEDLGMEDFIPDLDRIHTAGNHLLALISDILDLSKIESDKMELHLEDFSVSDLLPSLEATISPLVERNGNTLEVNAEQGLVMHGDITKTRQALLNLLSNACKFTNEGRIGLDIAREGDWVVFRVSDSGIGMTPEQMDRLFQPFMQADSSTTRKYGGTGLGLVISKRFCEMMGGDILLASEVDVGSTFTIRLPHRFEG